MPRKTLMPRDAEQTRRRLLDAGRAEFAAAGIAGARVDRIAAAALSNKAQIYHYFLSKEGLFDAVLDDMVAQTIDDTHFDVDDLPGYAGRLFDSFEELPWLHRLGIWYRLEFSPTDEPNQQVTNATREKIAALDRAQRDGRLKATFTPAELLGLVIHQAEFWRNNTPEYAALVNSVGRTRRRAVVVRTVQALLAA